MLLIGDNLFIKTGLAIYLLTTASGMIGFVDGFLGLFSDDLGPVLTNFS
jgi:hypothetical protein